MPNMEFIAAREINAIGFRTQLFQFMDYRRTAAGAHPEGRRRKLFPGYLFSQFDPTETDWPLIFRMRGVRAVLCVAYGRPAQIPTRFIQRWQSFGRAGDGVIDKKAVPFAALALLDPDQGPPDELAPGTEVRVLDGPFASFTGFLEASDADRVLALISIFGRDTPVELPRTSVQPI